MKVGDRRRPRQNISFAEEESKVVLEVESCFDFPDDIRSALWNSRKDYEFARSSARVIAKESERYGHSRHLDGVYYLRMEPQEAQDSLNLWCLHGNTRRGLERWANAVHGNERKEDQYMYVQGVLKAQAEMKLKDEFSEERLSQVAHLLSSKSRTYAKMLGDADSHAAKWEYGMVDACEAAVSPRQIVRKNLGLGGGVAARGRPAPAATTRRSTTTTAAASARRPSGVRMSPTISLRSKPGRVPRMA
eukprot:Nitzschia sp. Nitz4//scaffold163_size50693//30526//31266//NITZ4_006990-RA/size50693-processed-gene-0.48-mRNA-1//-1//CDS//3329538037//1339//frame0